MWKPLSLEIPGSSSPALAAHNTPLRTPDATMTAYTPAPESLNTAPPMLTPSGIHTFCNRDTILYMPYPSPNGFATQKLWKTIHRTWYPQRSSIAIGPTGACKPGHWFGKAVVVTDYKERCGDDDRGTRKMLGELLELHEYLVEALRSAMGGFEEGVALQKMNPRESLATMEGEQWYQLKRTVRNCFVVVEGDAWETEVVVVVWWADTFLGRFGSGKVVDDGFDNSKGEHLQGKVGKWMYKSVRLEEAVLGIMATREVSNRYE